MSKHISYPELERELKVRAATSITEYRSELTNFGHRSIAQASEIIFGRYRNDIAELERAIRNKRLDDIPVDRIQIILHRLIQEGVNNYLGKREQHIDDKSVRKQFVELNRNLSKNCIRCERRLCLIGNIHDEQIFRTCLWYLGENGDIDDLKLLDQIGNLRSDLTNTIYHELINAINLIGARVYDPQCVVEREERAYQQNRNYWDVEYAGQFIALHLEQVIAVAPTKAELYRQLNELRKDTHKFRAYIVQVGSSLYEARGPTRLHLTRDET